MIEAVREQPSTSAGGASLFHVIDPRTFERALLDELCELATRVRTIAKTPTGARFLQELAPNRRAMLYFTQPSTRTFLSFNNACHLLGIRTSEIRDPSISSEVKGESFEDAIRTFSSYVDIIMGRPRCAARDQNQTREGNREPRSRELHHQILSCTVGISSIDVV